MGRYSGTSSQRESSVRKPQEPHAIWRGIGCVLMIVVPVLSMAIGTQIVKYALANKISVPVEFLGKVSMPGFIYNSFALRAIFKPLTEIQNLYANLVAGLICMILISSLISLIYAVAYRIANPYRYGPTDAPPPKRKVAKKSR
jgi:hypothetical protein